MTYQVDNDLEVGIVNTSWHKELGDLELLRVHQFVLLSVSILKRLFNSITDEVFYLSNAQVSELSSSQFVMFNVEF